MYCASDQGVSESLSGNPEHRKVVVSRDFQPSRIGVFGGLAHGDQGTVVEDGELSAVLPL